MIEIPLTQGQVALIDDEDYGLVSKYRWCAAWKPHIQSFYARTSITNHDGKETTLLMHRLIMDAQKWHAQIGVNGKVKHLGYFPTPELAHEAYCKGAHELHGEFMNAGDRNARI